jgi:hypothetical protein
MATLTNNFRHCELLNLGYGPRGRGPFVVRQDGSAPGSMTLRQDRFLLRKDGTWVLNLAVFVLSEKEKEDFLYATSADIVKLLDELTGPPVVEEGLPPDKSVGELTAAAEATLTGIWGRIRNARPSSPPSS